MKNIKNNNSGFTLLEVIIVIIIVGVLASLALPRLVGSIQYSRSQEPLDVMGLIRKSVDNCSAQNNYTSYALCQTWAQIGVTDPGTTPQTHFGYGGGPLFDGGNTQYTITATRNAADGGDGTSTIWLNVSAAGVVTRGGTGVFVSIK